MRVTDLFEQSTSTLVFPDGSRCSAREIAARGRQLANHFRREGFSTGDRVGVCLPNGRAYLELFTACAVARLVLVSINTRYSVDERNDLVQRSGARRVFDRDSVDQLASFASDAPFYDKSESTDPFLVFTTSGTTSKPKMVRHRQQSIAVHGHHAARAFGYNETDTVLLIMPLCGTFGVSSLTAALAGNATIVVADTFDAIAIAQTIVDHGVTVLNGSDDMFHRLVEANADLSTIRIGGYARFNTSLDGIVGRAEKRGAILTGLYGMSEVQALYSLRDPSGDAKERSQAGGRLVSNEARYRIIDNELQLKGPSLFEGYLAEGGVHLDDDLTARHFSDGWFRTGDGAATDDDHTFTYYLRLGDVLRLGGFLVSPTEIESVLCELPAIDQAQVVAVDLPTGARPVAFVTAPDGCDEEATIAHCVTRLARYKIPIRVVVVDEFPITPSANGNKVQRVKLRDMAADLLRG